MPNDDLHTDGVATGIANFPEHLHPWIGVLYTLACCVADPEVMKKLTETNPETFDFIKRGGDGRFFIDELKYEKYFKEHMNEIFEQQKAFIGKYCAFLPDEKRERKEKEEV